MQMFCLAHLYIKNAMRLPEHEFDQYIDRFITAKKLLKLDWHFS